MNRIFLLAILSLCWEDRCKPMKSHFFFKGQRGRQFHLDRFTCVTTSASNIRQQSGSYGSIKPPLPPVSLPLFIGNEFVVNKNFKCASLNAVVSIHDFVSGTLFRGHSAEVGSDFGSPPLLDYFTDEFIFILAKEAKKGYLATALGQISDSSENFTLNPSQKTPPSVSMKHLVVRR